MSGRFLSALLGAALGFSLMGASGRSPVLTPPAADAYRRQIESWHAERLARLRSEDGWLTLVGLFWLEPGDNTVGSEPGSRVVLPGKAPPRLGSIHLKGGAATLSVLPGVAATHDGKPVTRLALRSDAEDEPTLVQYGSLSLYLIRRGERLGVRVKDAESRTRREFRGIETYPVDPKWRIPAHLEPYDPPKTIPVPNVLGKVDQETSPGALVFEHGGKTYRLDPVLERGTTDLFVIFGDLTNGRETYGAGRFLYAPPPTAGKTVLDFNKAYNPPCVFTPYATCPLPPPGNRLPFRVEAGEKKYGER